MDAFATVPRTYKFSGGDRQNLQQPSATQQTNGFKPTYYDENGVLVKGDKLYITHLNYIFNDLYAKAAQVDALLTAHGG